MDVITVADGRVLVSLESSVAGFAVGSGAAVLGDLDSGGANEFAFAVLHSDAPARTSHTVVVYAVPDIAIGVTSPNMPGKPGEVRVFSGKRGGAELYRIDQESLFEQLREASTEVDGARD